MEGYEYDFDSLEGIEKIPVPSSKGQQTGAFPNVTVQIEYILQRKATQHKRNGRMDLAIACLRKSNELMPYSPYTYRKGDFLRLVEYLIKDRQFDEAQKTKNTIEAYFARLAEEEESRTPTPYSYGTDLVMFSEHYPTCEICAKYQGRVYSISGADNRFPPISVLPAGTAGRIHEGCKHTAFPWIDALQSPAERKEARAKSNAPFEDTRSTEERDLYDRQQKQAEEMDRDYKNFNWLCENLSEISPKSFGGYRRMKNSNSINWQKLKERAEEAGRTL